MLRRKPVLSLRALVACGLAVAMLLPGAGAAAVFRNPGVRPNYLCATIPRDSICPESLIITRADHRDRRRVRRQDPSERHPEDDVGSFVDGAQIGGQSFGEWLRIQMRARRMTQRQLGQLTGVSHSSISRFLIGERNPKLNTALAIQAAFHEDLASVPTTVRVERALRSDDRLDDGQVRKIMGAYLAMRTGADRPLRRDPNAPGIRVLKAD